MNALFAEQRATLKTIQDWIRFAATYFSKAKLFYGHGTTNAWDEATQLVLTYLHAYDFPFTEIGGARLTPAEKEGLSGLIDDRVNKRIPLPYLTQKAFFTGLDFYVDERVLIPRSPIGELIENRFEPWLDLNRVDRMLDLCCGSGCIAISMAQHLGLSDLKIDAVDISPEALAVAKINLDRYELNDQITLIQSDLFSAIPPVQYDLIVCNPPYVDGREMRALPPEYQHEPTLALASGEEGLDFIHRLLKEAKAYLRPKGILMVEVGVSAPALVEAYPHLPFIWLEFERGGEGVFILFSEDLPT